MIEAILLGAGVVAGLLVGRALGRRERVNDAYDRGFSDGVYGERYSTYHPSIISADDMEQLVDRAKRVK